MINKLKAIVMVFLNQLLKELRMVYMGEENFVGKYAEIEIERRQWTLKNGHIIVGEKTFKNAGGRKIHQQVIFHVADNIISKWLGFKKNRIHYVLAGWHQPGKAKPAIGGITLQGELIR